jgi:hypothetical protein
LLFIFEDFLADRRIMKQTEIIVTSIDRVVEEVLGKIDYGSITLLFQDRHGGLQVRSPKGTFVDAIPIADNEADGDYCHQH